MSPIKGPMGIPGSLCGASRAMRHLALAVVAALALAGCVPSMRPPALVAPAPATAAKDEATLLWGRVVAGYSTQATPAQLLSYATVTLLDGNNQVVATGLTDGSGAFGLNPFVSWTPTTNAVYVLDALKSFDKTNDRAGLRFRTLVSWDGSRWRSLSGTTLAPSGGSGVVVSAQTTALAAIQGLRALSASTLLGSLDPATGAFSGAGGLAASEVATVTALVNQALQANLDPVALLGYSSSDGSYRLKLGGNSARVLFDLEDAVGQTMNIRSAVRGHDGGLAYAFAGTAAYYQSQLGGGGSANGLMLSVMGVDADRYGNVYAADFGNHRVQKFSAEGRHLWSIGASGSQSVQFQYPTDVRVDHNGNLLVTDYYNNRLQKLDPYGNLIFGIGGGTRWTGAAPAWSTTLSSGHNFLTRPHFAKFDPTGNFWISDTGHHRVLKYDANGNFLLGIGAGTKWTTSYQPNGLSGLYVSNHNGTLNWGAAVARNTDAIATDGTHAYVHDGNGTNGGFYKVRLSDGALLAGPGATPYLNSMSGAMAYVNGRLYYRGTGTGANKIIVVDTTTMNEVGHLLQNGTGAIPSANNDAHPWGTTAGWTTHGLATDGRYLYIPADTAAGTTFTIRIYDPFNNMAWVRDVVCTVPAGTMNVNHHGYYANGDYLYMVEDRTSGGSRLFKFRLADGAYLGTEVYHDPLAANPTPTCYDYVNQKIYVQEHATGRIVLFNAALNWSDPGWFNTPTGLAIAPNGDLYVSDRGNHRIQKFDANGNFLTQWGGQGSAAGQFETPEDVALDNAGNVWVTEYQGHRIQKFDRSGAFQAMVGSAGAGNGQFSNPRGIAIAPDGTILVGDASNHRIQRLVPASPKLVSPASGYFDSARGTISFWFKPSWNGSDTRSQVFFRQNGTNSHFGLHKMGSQFYFYVTDNVTVPARALRVGMNAADTARTIKAGEWHHLAVTWEGGTGQLRMFLNGTEYASYATNLGTPMAFGTSGPFHIGSEPEDTYAIDSVLDDFRIFDTPKSAEEILRDYRGLVQE